MRVHRISLEHVLFSRVSFCFFAVTFTDFYRSRIRENISSEDHLLRKLILFSLYGFKRTELHESYAFYAYYYALVKKVLCYGSKHFYTECKKVNAEFRFPKIANLDIFAKRARYFDISLSVTQEHDLRFDRSLSLASVLNDPSLMRRSVYFLLTLRI